MGSANSDSDYTLGSISKDLGAQSYEPALLVVDGRSSTPDLIRYRASNWRRHRLCGLARETTEVSSQRIWCDVCGLGSVRNSSIRVCEVARRRCQVRSVFFAIGLCVANWSFVRRVSRALCRCTSAHVSLAQDNPHILTTLWARFLTLESKSA